MKHVSLLFLAVLFLFSIVPQQTAAQAREYEEGSVWEISYIKTKSPYFEDYMSNLNSGWRKVMDEAKSEGLIMNYMVLSSDPSYPQDWDLMLMIEYKNMAALDNLTAGMEKIQEKLFGSEEERQAGALARNDIRELMGNRLARELKFK